VAAHPAAVFTPDGEGLRRPDPFRVLAASAPVGIMLVDGAGRVGYVNQRCREITGVKDDDGTATPFLRAVHPADRRLVLAVIRTVLTNHVPGKSTFRLRDALGLERWVCARFVPAPSEANRRMYAVWLEDVTAEQTARAEAERLCLVLEQSTDFVTIIDVAGRLLYANETVRRFFDVGTGADLRRIPRGLGFTELSQWRLTNEVFPALARDDSWTGELTLVASDGTEVPILQASVLHRDADGRPAFVAGIGRDVTDLKRSEQRLAASEARFRALVDQSLDLAAIINAEGRITYASPSYTRVLGYYVEELLGRSVLELVHPDDVELVRQHFWSAAERQPVEYRVCHRDGQWRRLRGIATPLFHEPAIRGVVVNARAIT